MTPFPSLFISHGSPDLLLRNIAARDFLAEYGRTVGKPRAVLVASAHFEAGTPTVSSAKRPETIYDFNGFPPELYALTYAAPGSPELAQEVAARLGEEGFETAFDDARGFDHGVWVPLMLLYPDADVPVVTLSVCPGEDTAFHERMGAALAPLREDGVLVVGSGSLTHNLRAFFNGDYAENARPPEWVSAFRDWVVEKAEIGARGELLDYRRKAPHAIENHPTEEHFLPFFVALGAGGGHTGKAIHSSYDHGILAMDAIAFS